MFISVLMGEERPNGESDALREVVDAVDRGEAIIVASAITSAEVLGDGEAPDDVRAAFDSLFSRPSFVRISAGPEIFAIAGRLRQAASAENRSLKVPDATHIATAMAYRCDAFHTFDDKLLALNGRPYVDGLRICKPAGLQTVLDL